LPGGGLPKQRIRQFYSTFIQCCFSIYIAAFPIQAVSDGLDVWNGCIVFLVYNFCQYRNKNKFEAGGSKIDITVC